MSASRETGRKRRRPAPAKALTNRRTPRRGKRRVDVIRTVSTASFPVEVPRHRAGFSERPAATDDARQTGEGPGPPGQGGTNPRLRKMPSATAPIPMAEGGCRGGEGETQMPATRALPRRAGDSAPARRSAEGGLIKHVRPCGGTGSFTSYCGQNPKPRNNGGTTKAELILRVGNGECSR